MDLKRARLDQTGADRSRPGAQRPSPIFPCIFPRVNPPDHRTTASPSPTHIRFGAACCRFGSRAHQGGPSEAPQVPEFQKQRTKEHTPTDITQSRLTPFPTPASWCGVPALPALPALPYIPDRDPLPRLLLSARGQTGPAPTHPHSKARIFGVTASTPSTPATLLFQLRNPASCSPSLLLTSSLPPHIRNPQPPPPTVLGSALPAHSASLQSLLVAQPFIDIGREYPE